MHEDVAALRSGRAPARDRPRCRDIRIHSTSIGAPSRRPAAPARSRTTEWRPSAPTTRSARISSGPSGVVRAHADDRARLLDQAGRPRVCMRRSKPGYASRLFGEEIEEVPLRHEREELAARRQVREVGDRERCSPTCAAELRDLLMRPLQELVEQPELVHHLERRGMDRVAAEIAQEIARASRGRPRRRRRAPGASRASSRRVRRRPRRTARACRDGSASTPPL